ncbi:hypothetical protein FACS1894105_07360 [Clostridia bacterium]|nr:hypothetical protein FACS1894105_07360 [Clostridia bacterium]
MKKRKKKPLEFMQCAVIAALCLPFLWVTYSYILAQQDKINTLENLSMTVITVPVAAIIGYVIQVRADGAVVIGVGKVVTAAINAGCVVRV